MPLDDMKAIYSKTLKISSDDIWQDFSIMINNTVIKLFFRNLFNSVFEVVQGSAKKTNGGLTSVGANIRGGF